MKRIVSLALAVTLLLMGTFAISESASELDKEYLSELEMLNAYMRNPDEQDEVSIQSICDLFEVNGINGEFSIEFELYANILRFLEEGDYTSAKDEVFDLQYTASFDSFRTYLVDGEELHSLGLYAIGTVENLLYYTRARAYEAEGNQKMAVLNYNLCQRFMDARDRMTTLQK